MQRHDLTRRGFLQQAGLWSALGLAGSLQRVGLLSAAELPR